MPITVLQHIHELQYAGRQEIADRHERQTDVQSPEAQADIGLQPFPELGRRRLSQGKHGQGHGQHSEHTHHGRMAVVRGQQGPRLKVADDRQIDQEAEDSRSDEIPEPDRNQEIERPLVRHCNRFTADVAFGPRELDEIPGVQRQ